MSSLVIGGRYQGVDAWESAALGCTGHCGRLHEVLLRRLFGRMSGDVRAPGGRRYRLPSFQLIRGFRK